MKVQQLSSGGERSFAVVLDPGEEAVSNLLVFAEDHDVTSGRLTGLGAFQSVVLGFFDVEKKDYDRIEVREQVEVVALLGNFAMQDDQHRLHPHVVVSKRDASALGGHLLEGVVRPTLEVIVVDDPAYLRRRTDPNTGLPLLSL